ncbi:MAG: AAA family ATPase [Thermodesulfobacteriota bacterium]
MKEDNEKIPSPKKIEKEISEFLTKKFGDNVKIISPLVLPREETAEKDRRYTHTGKGINFNMKPEELVAYLDQYIVRQESAKAILATKICTHFNRIKHARASGSNISEMVGRIKNNVLMIGPTGVGKTYMIKLIASKIGVPFVKGDATKFSETGYVGGDVEDLVRDLVREADGDIELAQYGIIYIDEIDKIASSRNMIGADVSRTGVQRALLKPLEETEVDLKVPHDPISMMQEIERFRKTGERDKRTVNTKNILFIVSGAFTELIPIISKRISDQGIGFGAHISKSQEQVDVLKHVRSEDLIAFGFESEFVGRLPVRSVFEKLTEADLFEILKNPNNPIILGKKLDFSAYGIDIKFEDEALRILAGHAFEENTGARGLISAVEKALLEFEKKLPSTHVKKFAVTATVIQKPREALKDLLATATDKKWDDAFERLVRAEKEFVKEYVRQNQGNLTKKYNLTLTPSRIDILATFYCRHVMDINHAVQKIKTFYDEIKNLELSFFKSHDINIVLEDDAVDYIIEQVVSSSASIASFYDRMSADLKLGLKLIQEKTNKNRFFINRQALMDPETFLNILIKNELSLLKEA